MVSNDNDNPLPPPPLVVILGVEVYPLPFDNISTEVITPFVIVATAWAAIPQLSDGSSIINVGADT